MIKFISAAVLCFLLVNLARCDNSTNSSEPVKGQRSYGYQYGYQTIGPYPQKPYSGEHGYDSYKPSYDYKPSYPSYDYKPSYPSYDYKPSYPSYDYKPSYPSYDYKPSYPSYDYKPEYKKPEYYEKPVYGSGEYYHEKPNYDYKPSYPSYDYKPSYPSYDYKPSYPSYDYKPSYPSYDYKPSYPSYDYKPSYPSYDYKPSYPSYDYKPEYKQPYYNNEYYTTYNKYTTWHELIYKTTFTATTCSKGYSCPSDCPGQCGTYGGYDACKCDYKTCKSGNVCSYDNIYKGKYLHPYSYDSSRYIQCDSTPGVIYIRSCPYGLVFDARFSVCNYPSQNYGYGNSYGYGKK